MWWPSCLVILYYVACIPLARLGKQMKLSESAEEAATFFGKMLDHDYTKKDVFCENFFADWRKVSRNSLVTFNNSTFSSRK